MRMLKSFSFLFLLAAAPCSGASVSPVQKVIELLGSCKAKIEADLAAEGKAMGEFADFCDTTLKDTEYAIKTATGQIADLKATVEQTSAEIDAAGTEVEDLGSKGAQKGAEIAEAKKVRAAQHEDFVGNEKELLTSVDELTRAIVKLKSESLLQVGSVDSKHARNARLVASLQAQAPVFERLLEASYIPLESKKALSAFLQQGTDEADQDDLSLRAPVQGATSNYEDHNGGIMGTVQGMLEKAQGQLADLRKAEMEAGFSADMVERGLNEEVRVIQDKMASATARKSASEEALGKSKGELASTEKTKAEDEALLEAQTEECRAKAAEWATRQKTAGEEMGAIAKATEILQGGVKVFAQTRAVTRRARKGGQDEEDQQQDADQDRRDQISGYLQTMSHKYNSFALSQLAMSASQDPFGKVKGMIEEMIEKLLNDANKEATQKAFCDTETSKTRKSMTDKSMNLDTLAARVDEASTKRAELEQSIKELMAGVAELDKAMAEATAIRSAEHEEYLKSSKDFKDSADAVVAAISVLKSYYAGGAFVQVAAKSRSLKARQPELGGDQSDTAHTIIEVLEMSEEDFTRLLAESESDEQSSVAEYKAFAQDSRVSKASKESEIGNKESEVKSLTVDMNNHNEDKDAVAKELEAVQSYLDKLKPQCEEKAMSYEEKKERRENEIAGLKEALSIVAGDSVPAASLVQKKRNLRRVQRAA